MITKKQIANAMECGTIRLITDPNLNSGTVCAVGYDDNFWFYFGNNKVRGFTAI